MIARLLQFTRSGTRWCRQHFSRALVLAGAVVCISVNTTALSADEPLLPPLVPPEFNAGDSPDWKPADSNRPTSAPSSSVDDLSLEVPVPPEPFADRGSETEFAESALDAARRRQEKELRYQQLQDRLRRMIILWKEQELARTQADSADTQSGDSDANANTANANSTTAAADMPASDSATGDAAATASPVIQDTAPGDSASDEAGSRNDTVPPESLPESADIPSSPNAASAVLAQQLAGSALVEGPVDRIGLADNLYGMGEIVIALQMYDNVETTALSVAEKHWITFQSASCLRRLNRIPEAQERYRRLAGEKDAGWLAKAAMWWLDHIDQRSEVESQIRRYQELIDPMKEPKNAPSRK